MASGHVNRTNRPNTWLLRPLLHVLRKLLPTRSRPHMARSGKSPTGSFEVKCGRSHECGARATLSRALRMAGIAPSLRLSWWIR